MIKDIVVNLSVGERAGFAGDYAVSVAAAFGAHVTGVAFLYDAIVPISGAGYIPADVVETQQRDNAAAVKAAIGRFTKATARSDVAAAPVTLGATFTGAAEQFGRLARCFDLAVVDQSEPETSQVEQMIAEAALFESGRPVIIVPYIQRAPLKLDRVLVCWDGGRAATRAVADAMPLLERASRVEVVVFTKERGKHDEFAGADIGQHLARHGLKVEVDRTVAGDIDVADALLSYAADAAADFIVMGGYGHSRLREFVLGGVTRSILRTMTAPVLMSH